MNQTILRNYERLAQRTGLQVDREGGALYGTRDGFSVLVYPANLSYPYLLTIAVAAVRESGPLTREEGKAFRQENPAAGAVNQSGFLVSVTLKSKRRQEKLAEALEQTLAGLGSFLQRQGYVPCCQTCGRKIETEPRFVGGGYAHLCQDCYAQLQQRAVTAQAARAENRIGGAVGALLGSLIGVLCIVLISQLGYVAALSGLVMAVCTLKGYEMLGGRLSGFGIAISSVLMLAMTYVGDRLDWAIIIARELEVDLFSAFRAVPLLLSEQMIDVSNYWGNLALLYLFLLAGAVPTVLAAAKNRRRAGRVYTLGRPE